MRSARFALAGRATSRGAASRARARLPPHERSPRVGRARPERRQHARRLEQLGRDAAAARARARRGATARSRTRRPRRPRLAGHARRARRRRPARRRRHRRRHEGHDLAVADRGARPGRRRAPAGTRRQGAPRARRRRSLHAVQQPRRRRPLGHGGRPPTSPSPCSRATSRRRTASTATGISSPDMAHEQLLPVAAWGTSYVAAQLTPQPGVCDPAVLARAPRSGRSSPTRRTRSVRFRRPRALPPAPDRTIGAGEAFHFSAPGDFAVHGLAAHPDHAGHRLRAVALVGRADGGTGSPTIGSACCPASTR